MSPRSVQGVVAVGLLALSACGSGGSGSSDDEEGLGPLAELMGWTPQEPAESRRKELEREQAVADCMREEGWDYEPVDWSSQMPDTADEDVALYNDPEAYGTKYGYGVARNYELYEAESVESGEPGGMGVDFVDPNQDYVTSLSQDEQQEYYATLYGEPIMAEPDDESGVVESPPLEDQGCYGRAQLAAYGEQPMDDPDIQERLSDYWQGQQDDPRMQSAYDEWVECMGDDIDGLEVGEEPVRRPDQMYQVFDARKMELMGLERRPVDQSDPSAYDDLYSSYSDANGENEIGYYGTPEPINDADLEGLRIDEIAMWKTDWSCQGDADVRDLQRRIEQELVDELIADFPQLADRRASADAGS